MRNCPNCGAPFDPLKNKCQYCGTAVLDITGFDFSDGKPIFLKYRTSKYSNGKCKNATVTMKCIPEMRSFEMRHDPYMADITGEVFSPIVSMPEVTADITFFALPMDDGSLYKVEAEE